jgi:transcriptional regulator with XRE-family HTH domain
MSGRVTPNGQKIKELRKAAGIKQEVFADTDHASVPLRTYSNIENKNSPITHAKLDRIASLLKVPVEDLVLPEHARGARQQSGTISQVFELQRQNSAAKILKWRAYNSIEFEILVDLKPAQAAHVEELLTIIEYSCLEYFGDFLDRRDRDYNRDAEEPPACIVGKRFPEVHLRARAQELLILLEEAEIGVFRGSHNYNYYKDEQMSTRGITWYKFASADKSSITQPYNMGHVFNKTTKKWEPDQAEGPTRMPF